MNTEFKKRETLLIQLCVVIIGMLLVIGAVLGIYAFRQREKAVDAFAAKPIELTIKAVPDSNNGEAVTVFSTAQNSYQPLSFNEGKSYTLVVESDFETASEVTICYNAKKIKITENPDIVVGENSIRFSVGGKKRMQIEMTGLENAGFLDGLTIVNENEYTAYAASAEFLTRESTSAKRSFNLVLLHDIAKESNLNVSAPCTLLLNGKTLHINGDLVFETALDGVFSVKNSAPEQIKVKRFFAEAPKCDIVIENEFFDYNGAIGYYINAKSYNGSALKANRRTVKSAEMLYNIADAEQYPRLNPHTTIVFDSAFDLTNQITINVPVSFQVNAPVSASAPILIETWETGYINIEVTAYGSADNLFEIDAPECVLTWGCASPSIQEISEQMNVKIYNGADMSRFGLGGSGKGKILSLKLFKDKSKSAQEDVAFTVSGNIITLSIPYLINEI